MSPRTALQPISLVEDWREQLRTAHSDGASLLRALGLSPVEVGYSEAACRDFRLRVPQAFVQRMRYGDPHDPLLRQVLATEAETLPAAGFNRDPTGEVGGAIARSGIIHKYHGRLLLVVASGCAINCRYCFRRHFPYGEHRNSRGEWHEVLNYVREDTSIREVILSGGDPLVAEDE
ncbi:MAG: 4Fe-4S cluster-binding domain-containing protein, partial [Parahaliea sp.]